MAHLTFNMLDICIYYTPPLTNRIPVINWHVYTSGLKNCVDLEKPADLDPHCFQKQDKSIFSMIRMTFKFSLIQSMKMENLRENSKIVPTLALSEYTRDNQWPGNTTMTIAGQRQLMTP